MILGTGPRTICLDFVDIHYHGCHHRDPGELCHTTPRDGTSQCHRYLAGFVLCRAKPLVVAVTAVRSDEPKRDAVERLLDHVAALPFDVAGLLCDRGFYNGACIQQLRETAPVVLPIIRRGERMTEKLKTSISYWTEYTMYEGSERELRFPLAVCVSYQQGNRGNMACSSGHTRRAIWQIARQRKSKHSTRNARPSRRPSERCEKHVREQPQPIQSFGWCSWW